MKGKSQFKLLVAARLHSEIQKSAVATMQDFRKICTLLKVKPIAAIKFAEEKLGEVSNR